MNCLAQRRFITCQIKSLSGNMRKQPKNEWFSIHSIEGPPMNPMLADILTRFRENNVAVVGDTRKLF